jgi:hypothetical protein
VQLSVLICVYLRSGGYDRKPENQSCRSFENEYTNQGKMLFISSSIPAGRNLENTGDSSIYLILNLRSARLFIFSASPAMIPWT